MELYTSALFVVTAHGLTILFAELHNMEITFFMRFKKRG
jgi:hypothetical protein